MRFQPKFCPRPDCPAHSGCGFACHRRGHFRRRCDGRRVPRFTCLACRRGFSSQTFRLDWRLKRPRLLVPLFLHRVSKVTHRQSARTLPCSRSTEERHFRLLSAHCRAFHRARLAEAAALGGLGERFLLDELETYERARLNRPVTVPVLIEGRSGFVIDARAGAMAPRPSARPLSPLERQRKSESVKVVRRALRELWEFAPKGEPVRLQTDQKASYARLARGIFGARCEHRRTPSTRRRDGSNPLATINHTLARMRDGISRLVRETWAAAKLRRCLTGHLSIWICYRNYVRGRINYEPRRTPAMAVGLLRRRWSPKRLLTRRVFHAA